MRTTTLVLVSRSLRLLDFKYQRMRRFEWSLRSLFFVLRSNWPGRPSPFSFFSFALSFVRPTFTLFTPSLRVDPTSLAFVNLSKAFFTMFTKSIFVFAAALAITASTAVAKPVTFWPSAELATRTDSKSDSVSFNNYLGLSSMSNFDDFFGNDNFDSSENVQTIIVQEKEVVCQTEEIEIVQQKLVVLVETMKKILLEQVCEVEVQTIVIQQASSIISSFSNDISHQSSRSAGYDQNISGLLNQIVGSDGSLSKSNLGFKGSDVGNSSVAVSGNNWNDTSSPASVQKAKDLANKASNSTSSS